MFLWGRWSEGSVWLSSIGFFCGFRNEHFLSSISVFQFAWVSFLDSPFVSYIHVHILRVGQECVNSRGLFVSTVYLWPRICLSLSRLLRQASRATVNPLLLVTLQNVTLVDSVTGYRCCLPCPIKGVSFNCDREAASLHGLSAVEPPCWLSWARKCWG